MAVVCPPAQGCKQIDVNGRRYTVARDGKFHGVRDSDVKAMVKGGECFTPLTRTVGRGFVCDDCGFIALIRDHCGRCGGESLTPED